MCSLIAECATPNDADVVRGLCASLFLNLPPSVRTEKYEELLDQKGMCLVRALGRLTEQRLIDWGVPDGHAMLMMDVLFVDGAEGQDVGNGTQPESRDVTPKFVRAPAFPELGADGLPTAPALRAYMTKFQVACKINGLHQADQDCLQELIRARGVTGTGWRASARGAAIVFETLVTAGADGLPERLMLSLPRTQVDAKEGWECMGWLLRSVWTASDDSTEVLSKSFADPTPVRKKEMVALADTTYGDVLDQLVAQGAEPPEVTKRTAYRQLFGQIPECARVFDALEAASDGEVPLEKMQQKIRALGAKFSSLAKQQKSSAMMAGAYAVAEV